MGLLAYDSFSRADSAASWGTASDGVSVWTHPVGTDTLSVVSHQGVVTYAVGGSNVMLLGTGTSLPIEGRCRFQSSDASASAASVVLRSNAGGTTFYGLTYRFATQKLFIVRIVAGVSTTLTNTSWAADSSHVYRLRFRAVGTAPVRLSGRIWIDGTTEPTNWTVQTSDNTGSKIATAGRYGIAALPGVAASTVTFDAVNVGDMNLGSYHDWTTLQARVLTPQEYSALGGIITTRSGSMSFQPEDFLCKNFTGVWVVPHATFMANGWERISDPDGLGFYIYGPITGSRMVTVTDQGDTTMLCSDGTVADTDTFNAAYMP